MSDQSKAHNSNEPDSNDVKNSEIIGRRLEEAHILQTGAEIRYKFEAFVDTRIHENLSVDLIGDSGNAKFTKAMPALLSPIAIKDFNKGKSKTPFAGWAGIRRKTISSHTVIRTPITSGDNPNSYHCDIVRDKFRTKESARSLAFELCRNAEDDRLFVPVFRETSTKTQPDISEQAQEAKLVSDGALPTTARRYVAEAALPDVARVIAPKKYLKLLACLVIAVLIAAMFTLFWLQ